MSSHNGDIEKLREAFSSLADRALPQPGCPEPDWIWAAARGELTARRRRKVVDHTSACPACAEAWRLAHDLATESPEEVSIRKTSFAGLRWSWGLGTLAAAAAGILLVAVRTQFKGSLDLPSPPVYRDAEQPSPRSLLPEAQPLSRHRFLLRWSAGPEGSRYRVEVTTEALRLIASAEGLDVAEYLVPEGKLVDLPPGAKLIWRVETTLPDGRRLSSQTFISRLD